MKTRLLHRILLSALCGISLFAALACSDSRPGSPYNKFGIQEAHYSLWDTGVFYPEGSVDQALAMFDNIDRLGVRNFRYTVFWYFVERNSSGIYDWSRHDILIDHLVSKGLDISILIGDSNEFYDSQERPPHPDVPVAGYHQAWLNFIEAAVRRYGDRVRRWEIWNEPDSAIMWGKPDKPLAPNPAHYVKLLAAASAKIREIQPHAFIIMAGVTPFPPKVNEYYGMRNFLGDCFALGALDHVNAVGIHAYRTGPEGPFDIDFGGSPNETSLAGEVAWIRNLIAAHRPGIGIWNTESGYINWDYPAERLHAQVKYVTRALLVEHALGLEGLTMFRLRDNTFADQGFEGMIAETCPHTRLPVFNALSELTRTLGHYEAVHERTLEQILPGGGKIRMEIYRKNDRPIIAYWLAEEIDNTVKPVRRREVTIPGIENADYLVRDILTGNEMSPGTKYEDSNGLLFTSLPVTDYPFLLIPQ